MEETARHNLTRCTDCGYFNPKCYCMLLALVPGHVKKRRTACTCFEVWWMEWCSVPGTKGCKQCNVLFNCHVSYTYG